MKNINLLNYRKSLGMKQSEMASMLQISQSYYAKIETGQRNASANFLHKFKVKFTDADIEHIFFSC